MILSRDRSIQQYRFLPMIKEDKNVIMFFGYMCGASEGWTLLAASVSLGADINIAVLKTTGSVRYNDKCRLSRSKRYSVPKGTDV